ncbi:uncharacterized protein Gasu_56000 [Galdieria sulphuraria]|uniref:Uncharacterized protein n=1 Tax=Galdieria sulphuraria TaxID=130081 RepID=M2WSH5_GALSU|nr:uncharacterized protein Gasu_56000 [Galdieria sulphuraria]EME26810.1 hypothetical protein Gasu_56000 [Galdieria sulphuraria]|eukprot:XP_005703330.1 hypothetical protein Gasu_56000 [Galdieria sulphuraria]
MLRPRPGRECYLRQIFRLQSQMQYINDVFHTLQSYCLTIELGKQFNISESIRLLNFLYSHLIMEASVYGLNDPKSQVFLKIFLDCLVPVSEIVDGLLSRSLSSVSSYIIGSGRECYTLRDLKIFEAISSRMDAVLNEYMILCALTKPKLLDPKGKPLHELFNETTTFHMSFNSLILFSYKWRETIINWSTTTLLEFQQHNMHTILESRNVLESLDSLHHAIFGGLDDGSFNSSTNSNKLLQHMNSCHLLGTCNYETFEKMLRFSQLIKISAFILGRMRRKLVSRLEMRTAFEMQHFLNVLLDFLQKGQFMWFQKTRQKLSSAFNLNQFHHLLNEHHTICSSYLFCRQKEKPIHDVILMALQKITQFVKYCRRLPPQRRTYRDIQKQELAILQAYQKSCNMLCTVLSFKRNESDIDPLLVENMRQLLLRCNYSEYYYQE